MITFPFETDSKFESQIEDMPVPFAYMGQIYTDGSDVFMFSQIAYGMFTFINIKNGNRHINGVQLKSFDDDKHNEGYSEIELLRKMSKEMGSLTYLGTIKI